VPPEGKQSTRYTKPGDPPSPVESRGQRLGLTFTRGREWRPNSMLSLEAAEFVGEEAPEKALAFHKAMFKAYFDDLQDIGKTDTILRVAGEVGVDAEALRASLESGRYRDQLDEELSWAQEIGVHAVPTFVLDRKYALVGAQERQVFEDVLERLGKHPRDNGA
jgi:predicted DsbA family dithiol-disulfide isomerase